MRRLCWFVGLFVLLSGCPRGGSDPAGSDPGPAGTSSSSAAQPSGAPGKPPPVRLVKTSENLLRPDGFTPYEKGGDRKGETFVCDNGSDTTLMRGIMQKVQLNQAKPEPVFA